jgi:hypothetical protein
MKNRITQFVVALASIGLILLILSMFSLFFGSRELYLYLMVWTYTFFTLFIVPLLTYFGDVYQAMQLKRGMNLGIRSLSYPKKPKKDNWGVVSQKNFEWTTSSFALLHSIRYDNLNKPTIGDFSKIAGIKRSTASGIIKKMLDCDIIKKDEFGEYQYSGVDFDVYLKKGKKIERVQNLSKVNKERLQYLFKLLCFVAF